MILGTLKLSFFFLAVTKRGGRCIRDKIPGDIHVRIMLKVHLALNYFSFWLLPRLFVSSPATIRVRWERQEGGGWYSKISLPVISQHSIQGWRTRQYRGPRRRPAASILWPKPWTCEWALWGLENAWSAWTVSVRVLSTWTPKCWIYSDFVPMKIELSYQYKN